ncbi:hypothetical protein B0O80DRAFT_295564 [Mortierella sp. GBAus27b]|nr:hypothetical protein B0O80DRAFT_295564 [Mortierella sp. GBAus27b]
MDGTDSDQYPSPLVMLIKFPHLEILSSRHRRKQTSLTTDIHTLKAMLRDGRVAPYSLRLRRWDIFHPYMTEMVEEDVAGFQGILNAISIVGAELNETRPPSEKEPASDSKKTKGVQLDIRLCHGPGRTRLASTAMSWINNTNGTFAGVGMHWGSATGQNTLGSQTETNTSTTTTHSSVAPPQICGNIVWTLERCRSCGTPQEQCHRCVDQCGTCHSLRAPPYVNHQLDMQRERSRYTNPASNHPRTTTTTTTTAPAVEPGHWNPTNLFGNRPRTPPGSISLSQMTNPLEGITSAYFRISQPLLGTQGSSVTPSIRVLDRPPEFSFFD